MARMTGDITIGRPIDVVFDFVADERNEPTYNPDLLSSEKVTAGPIGVGTKFTAVRKGRLRPMDMVIEVTEYDRPRRLGATTATPAGEVRGGLTFEEVEGGTRLRWLWEMRPRGVARFLGPLVKLIGNRQERACWAGLKRYLEGVPQSSRRDSVDPRPRQVKEEERAWHGDGGPT